MARKTKDPRYEEEAARYNHPVASRDFITETLRDRGVPMSLDALCIEFEITDEDQQEALRRRLKAMARDGQLISNRGGAWGLVERMDLVRGRVQANRDGFGFLIPENRSEDLFLHARQMRKVFDGDEVLARVTDADRRGRREARIVEILKRNTSHVIGRFRSEDGVQVVLSENPRIQHEVLVPPGAAGSAHDGQYVTVEITGQPSSDHAPIGRVVEVLGEHLAPGMEIEVAIRSHAIPFRWSPEVEAQTAELPAEPAESDLAGRFDLRDHAFVTIDGEDAKDFDDAVYCERVSGGGFRLWVAIADVSHYVPPGSPLDIEALARGNSVYFPGRVVPMLPEALSNGLCSLKPRVNRLALVCEMRISGTGRLGRFQFYEAVICSKARLTYNKVAGFLADPDSYQDLGIARKLSEPLLNLYSLYQRLRSARQTRGAIDFETTETRIVFGPGRKIERVEPVERNDAHRVIEECMLAANVATARFLVKHQLDGLYRVHEGPGQEKLKSLRSFLGELSLGLKGGDKPSPLDYQELLARVQGRADSHVIQTVLLRSLSQARYQNDNIGHFGLHYPAYTHFTSPIRRYPDLLVHRAIRYAIRSRPEIAWVARTKDMQPMAPKRAWPYEGRDMISFGEHCSMTERRADDATREVVSWLKCEFLREHIGEEFGGVVSGVTGFGLFVELDGIYADGLVHVSSLANDYYHYDAAHHRLVGEHSRRVYRLGDTLQVQIAQVDLDARKIDLLIAAAPETRPRRRRRS